MVRTIEFKLDVSPAAEVVILKFLEKGRNIYNLALTECLKRLKKIRADEEYQRLLAERKVAKKSGDDKSLKRINASLKAIRDQYGLNAPSIEKFVKEHGNYLLGGFNSQFAQVLADRAFKAVERIIFGNARKVRFKGKWDNLLDSIHSKSTDTGFFLDPGKGVLTYGKKLTLSLVDHYRNDGGYHRWYLDQIRENIKIHGCRDISFIRLVRRTVKGKNRFYAQFVVSVSPMGMSEDAVLARNLEIIRRNSEKLEKAIAEGKSWFRLAPLVSSIIEFPKSTPLIEAIRELWLGHKFRIGFDLGPKYMAAFFKSGEESMVLLQPKLAKVQDHAKEIRTLQRKLDRQRRANNPQNYNPNGTVKKGKRLRWIDSNGYKETRAKIRELNRLMRETRKTALGAITNIFIALGNEFRAEDIHYRTWQMRYGKSVARYAPSTLMNCPALTFFDFQDLVVTMAKEVQVGVTLIKEKARSWLEFHS